MRNNKSLIGNFCYNLQLKLFDWAGEGCLFVQQMEFPSFFSSLLYSFILLTNALLFSLFRDELRLFCFLLGHSLSNEQYNHITLYSCSAFCPKHFPYYTAIFVIHKLIIYLFALFLFYIVISNVRMWTK